MMARPRRTLALAVSFALLTVGGAHAITISAPFDDDYTATDLGSVPGLPPLYGGLLFLDNDTILIGGNANDLPGRFYTIDVTRDAQNRIDGFTGTAALFRGGGIGEYNDGGVVFAPNGTLLAARWPSNEIGQVLPGHTDEDKIIDLVPFGIENSISTLFFVPGGLPGGGGFRFFTWGQGTYYSADLVPDGLGTFDLANVARVDLDPVAPGVQDLPGGPEGIIYVANGNAEFAANSVLVADFSLGSVSAYFINGDGNPLVSTRRDFITGLEGAEGAAIDPLTGDFIFSTYGGGDRIVRVSGFTVVVPTPAPPMFALFGLGALALAGRRRGRASGCSGRAVPAQQPLPCREANDPITL